MYDSRMSVMAPEMMCCHMGVFLLKKKRAARRERPNGGEGLEMTETESLTGRALEAAVGEALGWTHWKSKHGHWRVTSPDGVDYEPMYGAAKFDSQTGEPIVDDWWCGVDELPNYSYDIGVAMNAAIVASHSGGRFRAFALTSHQQPEESGHYVRWIARFENCPPVMADTPALAICSAILALASCSIGR
jgi:hypothetical protein